MDTAFISRLRDQRSQTWDAAKAILDTALAADRDLTPDEQRRFDAYNTELDQIAERVKDLEETEQRQRDAKEAMDRLLGTTPERSGAATGRSWLPGLAEYRDLRTEQRAVGTTGAFIPVGYSTTYFDLLRKRTALLAAGPVILPVEHAGSVKVPKITSSVSVSALAENVAISPADPGLGSITLDPKKFGAMTLVAREAVEDSSPELRQVVADALVRDVSVELGKQLITGDGSGSNLLGLRNTASATTGAATGTNGGALTFGILADTLAAAEAANVDPEQLAWFMHSRTWSSVRKLLDSQNRPIVSIDPTQGVRPTLWGRPVYVDNNLSIAETKGTSSDCSAIVLADMSQVVVAQARAVELAISEEYAFNADQVAVRVTCRYDIGVPQPTAVTITDGVRP